MNQILSVEFIIYVNDQKLSADFYRKIFRCTPSLNVEGMTEFKLATKLKFGIMPNDGISRIIRKTMPHPQTGNGIPRCEIYLKVSDVHFEFQNALDAGAIMISPPIDRDWGDLVAYVGDIDGHVIAFAQPSKI